MNGLLSCIRQTPFALRSSPCRGVAGGGAVYAPGDGIVYERLPLDEEFPLNVPALALARGHFCCGEACRRFSILRAALTTLRMVFLCVD